MYQVFGIMAIAALVIVTASESAISKKKKLGALTADCSCNCFKDGATGPGNRTTVYFDGFSCPDSNGGGCRIRQHDGTYKAGTLRNCKYNPDKATGVQGGNSSEGEPVLSAD